jgi:hypothetical protein
MVSCVHQAESKVGDMCLANGGKSLWPREESILTAVSHRQKKGWVDLLEKP